MNVLSLFDGMSCGQIALNRSGIKYDKYFASEIKKHAIQVTQYNYPNTIQLGDIRNIKGSDLPKIDLLIGGSPCQDFSIANKERKGLQGLKSSLFYEYYRLLQETKPKYFLLENVLMSDKDIAVLSELMEIIPVRINSSLVSAQLRDRLYWTNIGEIETDMFGGLYSKIPQPKDKNIYLNNSIENGFVIKEKHTCLNTKIGNEGSEKWRQNRNKTTGMITLIYKDLQDKENTRFISQIEAEKLQTVPHGYTKILNKQKAIDLLGDGWTIDVICHIFNEGIKNGQFEVIK